MCQLRAISLHYIGTTETFRLSNVLLDMPDMLIDMEVVGELFLRATFFIRKTHGPEAAPPEIRRNSAINFF